jgi:hypothetical protein
LEINIKGDTMRRLLSSLILALMCASITIAGEIQKVVLPPLPPPPPMIYPIPPPPPPLMRAFGGLIIYMSDYKATLSLNGYPKFSFSEAFLWNTKEAITEASVGVTVPKIADGSFTWILPVVREGTGIPTVPLTLGGYTFGPRLADTINLKTKLSGERLTLSTPILGNRQIMPTGMCEWWHLGVEVNGTPNTTTTSQSAVNTKQAFSKIMMGIGVSGESVHFPVCVNYTALYAVGGHTHGWFLQSDIGYKQRNMAAAIGYRFNTRDITFGNGEVIIDTNGPYVKIELWF